MSVQRIILLHLLGISSLLLSACLHEPTETLVKSSLSNTLRHYQSFDTITYTVTGTATLLEDDKAIPKNLIIAVQETDGSGNLKYLTTEGVIVVVRPTIINGTSVNEYTDEAGNLLVDDNGNALLDENFLGKKPYLNCSDNEIENNVGSYCLEDVFLTGTLVVNWQEVNGGLIEPISNAPIAVLQETWSLNLTEADENFLIPDQATARLTSMTTRYISQSTETVSQGELFVHAYNTKPASSGYDWVSVKNPNQINIIAKATSDPSPITGSGNRENIQYDIYSGCDGVATIANCARVASTEKNMTYQLNQERRTLPNHGVFNVSVIIISGRVDRADTAVGAVDLGYNIFSNCSPDLPGITFTRRNVTYTGSIGMYPDVGALQFNFSCNALYDVDTSTVSTSVRINAKLVSTNIDFSPN